MIIQNQKFKQKPLNIEPIHLKAIVDGQTEFTIDSSLYDFNNSVVHIQSNGLNLFPGQDFSINENVITLAEGVPIGRDLGIYIYENSTANRGTSGDGSSSGGNSSFISGLNIAVGSIPLNRMSEIVATEAYVQEQINNIKIPETQTSTVTSDIPIHLSINTTGGLRITYDNGL